jgi:predicted xylose isomerase-like sugar epimerase
MDHYIPDTSQNKYRRAVHVGRDLAYQLRNTTAAQRAAIAAEDGDRHLLILKPTNAQRASVFKVSTRSLAVARALPSAERELVKRGLRRLVEPQDRKAAVRTDADVERLIVEIGPERVMSLLDKITQPMMFEAAE